MDGVMQQLPAEEKLLAQLRDSCAAGSQSSSPTSGYFEVRHHLAKCPPPPSTAPHPWEWRHPCPLGLEALLGFPSHSTRGSHPARKREVVGVESVQQDL